MQYVVSSKLREMVRSLLKNGSVGAKPVISFTEGTMLLFGRQNGFSVFSSMRCYSSIGMDAVGQPGVCLQNPKVTDLR